MAVVAVKLYLIQSLFKSFSTFLLRNNLVYCFLASLLIGYSADLSSTRIRVNATHARKRYATYLLTELPHIPLSNIESNNPLTLKIQIKLY
jgi:hypothetical protein